MSCAVLGVDPGVRGGLALLRADGSVAHLRAFRPDMEEHELVDAVRTAVIMLNSYNSLACFFERVQHMTGDGAQGSFTFGKVNGLLRGSLLALGVKPRDVLPMMWQAGMECLTAGDKNVSKRRALQLFPRETITHAVADALLIAEYGRRRLAAAP